MGAKPTSLAWGGKNAAVAGTAGGLAVIAGVHL